MSIILLGIPNLARAPMRAAGDTESKALAQSSAKRIVFPPFLFHVLSIALLAINNASLVPTFCRNPYCVDHILSCAPPLRKRSSRMLENILYPGISFDQPSKALMSDLVILIYSFRFVILVKIIMVRYLILPFIKLFFCFGYLILG